MEGWFKLHRKITESAVFADPEKLKVWVWILSKAGFKPKSITIKTGKGSRVVSLKKGEFIFGRNKAADDLCLSPSKCWRIMKWFESEGMILIKSNNQYSIINVINYTDYQDFSNDFEIEIFENEQPMNSERTSNEQPTDNQRTSSEHKEERKEGGKEEERKETPPTPSKGEKRLTKKQKQFNESIGFIKNAFEKNFQGTTPTVEHEKYGNLWKLIIEHQEVKQKKKAGDVFIAQAGATRYINDLIDLANKDINRAEKIVLQSIEGQWKGLFQLKENNTNNNGFQPPQPQTPRVNIKDLNL